MLLWPASSHAAVSESAMEIMQRMSGYLGGLHAFSVLYETETEFLTGDGQKLELSASGQIDMRRPDGAHITRFGELATTELFYDGKLLTLLAKKANAYFQIDSQGGIDAAIDDFRQATGMYAPGADLLVSDPFASLMQDVVSGEYVGDTVLDGVPAYHLAFRDAAVDWQIWVRADDHPVPMKYTITTKWMTGAPEHSIRFRNWNFEPSIGDADFGFVAPAGALKVDHVEVNDLGEIVLAGEQQ